MEFFNPTSIYKELLLLEHVEQKPQTSQHEIAHKIGTAASMVNTYMDKLEEKNYLVRDYKSPKVVHYKITPQGIKRKNYLAITYFHELLKLYKLAEENIERNLQKLIDKGYRNVIFYGAGEVAEIILTVLQEKERKSEKKLNIVALVDDNIRGAQKELLGYKIISKDEIHDCAHDGIVITSYTFENEILGKLEEMNYPKQKIQRIFNEMDSMCFGFSKAKTCSVENGLYGV